MSSRHRSQVVRGSGAFRDATEDHDGNQDSDSSNQRLLDKNDDAGSNSYCCIGYRYPIIAAIFLCVTVNYFQFLGSPSQVLFEEMVPFLCLLCPLATVTVILVRCGCTSHSQETEDDFDAIVQQVALKFRADHATNNQQRKTTQNAGNNDDNNNEDSEMLYTPLDENDNKGKAIAMNPPASATYHSMQDRQFSITDKKSGDVFLQGFNARSVMHLTFTKATSDNEQGLWSIQGSRTCHLNNKVNSNNNNHTTCFVIKQGWLSPVSKHLYWEETCNSINNNNNNNNNNSAGMAPHQAISRRIVTGRFLNASYTNFSGEWLSSDGTRGSLLQDPSFTSSDAPLVGIVAYGIPLTTTTTEEEYV